MAERFGFRVVPVHPGLITSDNDVHEVGITVRGVEHVLGKNSRMSMKVQGRPMQARFIEIHQVFAKKKSGTFLTEYIN